MEKTFQVLVAKDENGIYVGKVPELAGCLSQGDTLGGELMENIKGSYWVVFRCTSRWKNLIDREEFFNKKKEK